MSNNMYPPYGVPPMGGYGQGYPMQVPYPQATTIFVMGLLSLLCCGPLGIIAVLMGNTARKEIEMYPGRYSNTGLVTAGWVMGIISTIIIGLVVAYYVLVVAFAFLVAV